MTSLTDWIRLGALLLMGYFCCRSFPPFKSTTPPTWVLKLKMENKKKPYPYRTGKTLRRAKCLIEIEGYSRIQKCSFFLWKLLFFQCEHCYFFNKNETLVIHVGIFPVSAIGTVSLNKSSMINNVAHHSLILGTYQLCATFKFW